MKPRCQQTPRSRDRSHSAGMKIFRWVVSRVALEFKVEWLVHLIGFGFIFMSFDSSLNALSERYWLRFDRMERCSTKSRWTWRFRMNNESQFWEFWLWKFLTRLLSIEFDVTLYQSIAYSIFYRKSFGFNSIEWSLRSQNHGIRRWVWRGRSLPQTVFVNLRPNTPTDRHVIKSKVVDQFTIYQTRPSSLI